MLHGNFPRLFIKLSQSLREPSDDFRHSSGDLRKSQELTISFVVRFNLVWAMQSIPHVLSVIKCLSIYKEKAGHVCQCYVFINSEGEVIVYGPSATRYDTKMTQRKAVK